MPSTTSLDIGAGEPSSNVPATIPGSPPLPASPSQLKTPHRTLIADDHTASDTQSIRSGRSLASLDGNIRHPELHEAGLNASIIETVSATFENGVVTKSVVIGELALAFNPIDLSTPFGIDTIRLENFAVLDKVAPNPTFIDQLPDKPGSYTVNLSGITKTSIAFKYQVHLDDTNHAIYAPLVLSPIWKIEPTQASVILNYSLNPLFELHGQTAITLSNVVLVIHIEGAKATSCQTKPAGTFSKERSIVYWRLGDVTLAPDQEQHRFLARFITDGEAKVGKTEARWEISGENAASFGSGLGVTQLAQGSASAATEGDDPFADEGAAPSPSIAWKDVATLRKIGSGAYQAIGSSV